MSSTRANKGGKPGVKSPAKTPKNSSGELKTKPVAKSGSSSSLRANANNRSMRSSISNQPENSLAPDAHVKKRVAKEGRK